MSPGRVKACLLVVPMLVASVALGAPKEGREQRGRTAATSPTAEDRARSSLNGVVARQIAAEKLTLGEYSIVPSLTQLRRYVEPGRRVKVVCIVDLALVDGAGALIATVRGNATAVGASPSETMDAAAHAAACGTASGARGAATLE